MNRNCPCCTYQYKTPFYTTPTGQNIVACGRCKMVYAVNTAHVDYSNDSIYAAPTYDLQTEHYKSIIRNVMKNSSINVTASVLDVGCATGGLIAEFSDMGFHKVTGASLSQSEVNCCVERGLDAHVVDICGENPPAPEQAYDLVTLTHVLEHVPDVQGFLEGLARWVKPTGSVYIEVPNALKYTSYFSSICQGFNSEHINHFDLAHLERTCIGWDIYAHGAYESSFNGGKSHYPVIWLMARPHWSPLVKEISNYAENLDVQLEKMRECLHVELEGVTKLAIWGLGQTTTMLLAKTMLPEGIEVHWATDSNPVYHGRPFHQAVVDAPEAFAPPQDVPILVCSQLSQAAVVERIKELNLTNRIVTLDSI
jgi:SAM-dependent methyltransferase